MLPVVENNIDDLFRVHLILFMNDASGRFFFHEGDLRNLQTMAYKKQLKMPPFLCL